MEKGFWTTRNWPLVGLAPMDGVTDTAFRTISARYGKPGVIFTEFTAVEGIRAGAIRLLDDFLYTEEERPVVAQLFGSDPEAFFGAAVVASALGFDGIDINMGCPAKNITQRGAGAALILDPPRAQQIIRSAQSGTKAWSEGISLEEAKIHPDVIAAITSRLPLSPDATKTRRVVPVSVKTRTGYDHPLVEEWIPQLIEAEPAVITLHGRTLKQMYTGLADWNVISQAAKIAHNHDLQLLGNGDVKNMREAQEYCQIYGVDGVLIGRSAGGNPWLFQEEEPSFSEKMRVALEHARLLDALFNGRGFLRMRKHLLDYCNGTPHAKALRILLQKITTLADLEQLYRNEPLLAASQIV